MLDALLRYLYCNILGNIYRVGENVKIEAHRSEIAYNHN